MLWTSERMAMKSYSTPPAPTSDTLWSFGNNAFGKLGDGTTTSRSSPVQVGLLTDWAQVACGGNHTAVVKTDGTLWTNGLNNFGQLGDGTTTSRSSPVQVGLLTDWAQVAGGSYHTVAVKTDGSLWTFGYNGTGQLGDGTGGVGTNKSSPVRVGLLTDWAQVAGGSDLTAAVKTDGTLWSFGGNAAGQLGDGTTTNRSSPVQVGLLTDWAQVSCGDAYIVAVKVGGTLWTNGINGYGQLGNGTSGAGTNKSSPVQVGLLTDWAQVAGGSYHTVAVKTDGSLWTFGYNDTGQLGDGTGGVGTNKSSPVRVGLLTDWARVAGGNGHTAAVKTDETLWTFGNNASGQLGDGTTTVRSSPVQVGLLTDWAQVSCGIEHTAGIHL